MDFTKKIGLTALTLITAANLSFGQTQEEAMKMYQDEKATVSELQTEMGQMDINLSDYEMKVEQLNKKLKELEKENKTYRKSNKGKFIKQIDGLVRDTTEIGAKNRSLEATIAKKTKEYLSGSENTATELVKVREECDSLLNAKTQRAKKYISNLKDSIQNVNTALNQANNKINQYESLELTIGKKSVPMITEGQEKANRLYAAYKNEKAKNAELKNNQGNNSQIATNNNVSSTADTVYLEKEVNFNGKEMTATEAFKQSFKIAKTYAELNKEANKKITQYESLELKVGKKSVPMITEGQQKVNRLYTAYKNEKAKNAKLEDVVAGKRDSENKTNWDKAQELQQKFNEQKIVLNQYKSENEVQSDSIKSLNTALDGANNKLSTALENKSEDELYSKINTLEDKITQVQQEKRALVNSMSKAQNFDKKAYQDSIINLENKIAQYNTRMTKCKSANRRFKGENKNLKTEIETTKSTYEAKLAQAKVNNTNSTSENEYVLVLNGKTHTLNPGSQTQETLGKLGGIIDELDGKVTELKSDLNSSNIIRKDQIRQLSYYEDSISTLNTNLETQIDYTTAQEVKINELESQKPQKEIVYINNGNSNSNNNPYVLQIDLKSGKYIPGSNQNANMVGAFMELYLSTEMNIFKDAVTNSNDTEALEDRKMLNEFAKQYNQSRTDKFYTPK